MPARQTPAPPTTRLRAPARAPIAEPEYISYLPAYTIQSPPASIRVERDWTALDQAVRSLPQQTSVDALVQALGSLTEDEWARTRAVYRWLTWNVAYDTVSYFGGRRAATSPEDVFRTGMSVCQGYANLFTALATGLGLEARTVSGYAKGYSYRPGQTFASTNHAWNAVRLDGEWHLFDATWGAGDVDERRFVRDNTDFWFDPHPDLFLQSHLPEDPRWQLAARPITKREYEQTPYLPSYRFDTLWQYGFSDRDVVEALYTHRGLPEAFPTPGGSARILNAPLSESVVAGELLTFKVQAEDGVAAALINNDRWVHLARRGDYLFGAIRPSSGELSLSISAGGNGYYTALRYRVG